MQGQPGKNNKSWDRDWENERERLTRTRLTAITATGQHRAIPQRPPGMTRLKTPPDTPRIARPQRETVPQIKVRRRIIVLGSVFAIAAIIACTVGILLARGMLQSSGPASVINDFFNGISSDNYEQAYQDLGPAITLQLNQQDFIKQAQALISNMDQSQTIKKSPIAPQIRTIVKAIHLPLRVASLRSHIRSILSSSKILMKSGRLATTALAWDRPLDNRRHTL